jgi:hypothetical protein
MVLPLHLYRDSWALKLNYSRHLLLAISFYPPNHPLRTRVFSLTVSDLDHPFAVILGGATHRRAPLIGSFRVNSGYILGYIYKSLLISCAAV